MKRRFPLCILILLVFGNFSYSQTAAPVFVRDSLDLYVKRALDGWKVPGLAIAIVKNGEVILEKGWGVLEAGKPGTVNENSLFMIGSNTKAFTATLMAMLEAEKKCKLSNKVRKWVPEFDMDDNWVAEDMRLDDILCHRLGFETFQGDFMTFETDLSTKELMEKFAKLEPEHRFRTKWGYCNFGYAVAGEAIRAISGQSWEENIRKKLFEPLEMNRSLAMADEISSASNRSAAHSLDRGNVTVIPYMKLPGAAPCGAISSSVHDMTHWMNALLDSGSYKGRQVIPWDAINKTRQPFSIVGNANASFNRSNFELYGLGWFLQDYESRKLVMHDGGVDGFITSVTLVPEENLGIVVLTNTDANWLPFILRFEILDAFLELPYRNYSGMYLPAFNANQANEMELQKNLRDSVAMKPAPPLPLKSFAGIYVSEVYGEVELKEEGESLRMVMEHHPGITGKLSYMGNNRFLCEYSSLLLGLKPFPFKIEGKKVLSFELSVNAFVEESTYKFVKKK